MNSSPEQLLPVPASSRSELQERAYLTRIAEQIQALDEQAATELYNTLRQGIRFYFQRRLGASQAEDKFHELFMILVESIRDGKLKDPACMVSFANTIARRLVAGEIELRIKEGRPGDYDSEAYRIRDLRQNIESDLFFREKVNRVKAVLEDLSARDRDILTRFYFHEQSQEQICLEMGLTETQFRLLKTRAKSRSEKLLRKCNVPITLGLTAARFRLRPAGAHC